jgi:hypothetical protein
MVHLVLACQRVEMTPRGHIFPGDTFDFALRAMVRLVLSSLGIRVRKATIQKITLLILNAVRKWLSL